jgi:hypothetical protein
MGSEMILLSPHLSIQEKVMRLSLSLFALAVSAYAAEVEAPKPVETPDQAQAAPAPAPAPTPADATPPPPPAKYGGWVFSGLADAYVTRNGNSPTQDLNSLQNFNLHSTSPRFTLGKFVIDKSDGVIGVHADIGVGETMRLIHAGDGAAIEHKGLRYFEQMYAIVKPKNMHGMEVDFGQFVTSAGAEVIESSSNWNYTRSLLFAWAIPYYHFGLRTSVPVTKELTAGFQLVNAWNTVWGQHNMSNIGLTAAYTKPKFTYSANYYVGKTDAGPTAGVRNLFDTTILVNPTSKFSFYVNGDYGRNNFVGGKYAAWYGAAIAARYQITKIFAVAGRTEFFKDKDGFSTGVPQNLKEGTATFEGKLNDHLVARLEFRHDASDKFFFDRGKQPAGRTMNTLTLGIVALLGPLK